MSWLADIRLKEGLTQEQAALKIGISRAHLCNIENNVRHPCSKVAKKIVVALNLDRYGYNWWDLLDA